MFVLGINPRRLGQGSQLALTYDSEGGEGGGGVLLLAEAKGDSLVKNIDNVKTVMGDHLVENIILKKIHNI